MWTHSFNIELLTSWNLVFWIQESNLHSSFKENTIFISTHLPNIVENTHTHTHPGTLNRPPFTLVTHNHLPWFVLWPQLFTDQVLNDRLNRTLSTTLYVENLDPGTGSSPDVENIQNASCAKTSSDDMKSPTHRSPQYSFHDLPLTPWLPTWVVGLTN